MSAGASVLLVRAGALGDLLLLRRAVLCLGAARHEVSLMAPRAPGGALLGRGPADVATVLDWDSAETAPLLAGELPRPGPLRSALERQAAAIVYSRSRDLVRALRAMIPRVLVHDPTPPPSEHASAWLARPAEGLGGVSMPANLPPIEPSEAELAEASRWAARLPSRFLAVHPGSGSPLKNWPSERFGEVVAELAGASRWLLVVGPADREAARPLLARGGAVEARTLPPRVLGALLSRAGLYVGNDSGVSHLAAAYGAPTLALFGPTDPAQWGPVGPAACFLRSPTGTMAGLEPTPVVSRGLELLRSEPWQAGAMSAGPRPPSS
jgi:heptosyltransferase III